MSGPSSGRPRRTFLSWLTVFVLLTSVLSWTPALAQTPGLDPTATATATATATTAPATATSTTAPPPPTATSTTAPQPTATNTPVTPGTTVVPSATATPTATTPPNATFATVTGTGGAGLRCRATAVTGTILVVLAEGQRVNVRGATVNGWVPVTCANQNGWVALQYVRLSTGPVTTPTATATTTPGQVSYAFVSNTGGSNLRCRATPSTTGTTIVLLAFGTKVEVRGPSQNGWTPIKCAGQNGWASSAYLTADNTGTPPTVTPGTTPVPGGGTGKYVTVSGTGGAGLRCRTAPVTGTQITILPDGARVQLRGSISNGWYPVLCANQNGWISAAYTIGDIPVGSGELWLDVNLSTQYMRVFRGNTVIMQTYVSTGKPGFTTPTGTFYINRKLPTRTMTGVLGGEYYYVPNVPWVMYFTNVGHAIHGAYWHNSFGSTRSHGCINLPVPFASQLYSITPVGTRLRIHY